MKLRIQTNRHYSDLFLSLSHFLLTKNLCEVVIIIIIPRYKLGNLKKLSNLFKFTQIVKFHA